jgi:predicted tellurium resistance membrane protein TerC
MRKKVIRRINGSIAIYYGIGCAVTAIVGAIFTGAWLFKAFTNETEFSGWTLVGICISITVLGAMGYVLLRIGYEEMEK